ncbi:MAG: hypothetical protein HC918_06740 [Oscillatoriales cyanobacterium SM2_1_8]|nr:hypothetical protein [Oscillatoriales cyanobacterium SM2_1_8]
MRVFVLAGAGDRAGFLNPGAIAAGTTAAVELSLLIDRLQPALAEKQVTLALPPGSLTFAESLRWIENRTAAGDGAIELRLGAFARPEVRGASAFFIAINAERQLQADVLLQTLVQGVPGMVQRGARPDTESALGRLAFCRDLRAPSLSLELGYLTNPLDRELLQTHREDLAIALATGLRQWLQELNRTVAPPRPFPPVAPPFPTIGVVVNGQLLPEPGLLVNGNAYVPETVLTWLAVPPAPLASVPRLLVQEIAYLQAIGLRDWDISVAWERQSRTVALNTVAKTCLGELDRLMGPGLSTAAQLTAFARAEQVDFPDFVAPLLIAESTLAGVNHDVAFCQLCADTAFLQANFDLGSAPEQLRQRVHNLQQRALGDPPPAQMPPPTLAWLLPTDPDYPQQVRSLLRRLYEAIEIL